MVHSRETNLSAAARSAIEDVSNNRYLSVASLWEIAIKVSIEKLELSESFETLIPEQLAENGIEDRLIAAQAQVEQMTQRLSSFTLS
ncbi:MAG: type II toxin-antitoxin system VapC family toxin [Chloroflexota bacterium]